MLQVCLKYWNPSTKLHNIINQTLILIIEYDGTVCKTLSSRWLIYQLLALLHAVALDSLLANLFSFHIIH